MRGGIQMRTASERKIPMDTLDQGYIERRSLGRRREDWLMIDRGYRHSQLLQVGQALTSEINLESFSKPLIFWVYTYFQH